MLRPRNALRPKPGIDGQLEAPVAEAEPRFAWAIIAAGASVVAALVGGAFLGATAAWFPSPSVVEEIGFLLLGVSLPLLLGALVLLVEPGPAGRLAAVVGAAASLGALVMFAAWFPSSWSTSLSTPNSYAVVQYGIGVLLMFGAALTRGALQIARAGAEAQRARRAEHERSAQEAQRDLARAREEGYTWGGVPTDRPGTALVLEGGPQLELEGMVRGGRVRTEPGDRVQQAKKALMALRGRSRTRRWDEPVAAQAANLRSLRDTDAWRKRQGRTWWKRVLPPYS